MSTDDDGQCLSCGQGRYRGAKDDIAGSVTIGAAACEADSGLRRAQPQLALLATMSEDTRAISIGTCSIGWTDGRIQTPIMLPTRCYALVSLD